MASLIGVRGVGKTSFCRRSGTLSCSIVNHHRRSFSSILSPTLGPSNLVVDLPSSPGLDRFIGILKSRADGLNIPEFGDLRAGGRLSMEMGDLGGDFFHDRRDYGPLGQPAARVRLSLF